MAQVPTNLIPSRVTQLGDAPVASADGLLLYTYQGVSYKIRAGDLLQVAGVPTTRRVLAGTGLTGGGQLSSDITLSVAPGGIGASELNTTGVTPGVYGDTTRIPVLTVDAQGRIDAASTVPFSSAMGGTVTSVDVSGGSTGLTSSGGPIVDAGTITLDGTLNVANGGTGATTAAGARSNLSAAVLGANNDITSLSGVTGGISTPDYLQFDTGITPTVGIGKLQWDPTYGTLQVGLGGGNVNLQIGQESVQYCLNKTGSDIADFSAVYVTGAQGNRPTVALAVANSDATSASIIGVTTEAILNNQQGYITTEGMIHSVDTSAFAEGAQLWLSPTTPGALTTTKPQAPQHLVLVGYCVRQHAVNGQIYVKVQNGYELDELHDVHITSVANYNLLQYDSAGPYWKNVAGPTSAVVGISDSQTLTNKTISGASNTLSNIGNASLSNSSVTFNGTTVALGASGTITAANPNALTIGTHLTGTSYNGSAAVTIATDATNLNTASTIVARDGSGNFSAGTITAALSGNATTATNLAGGVASQLPYQTAAGTTSFIANGTAGQVLVSAGTSAPAWGGVNGGTF